MGLRIDQRQRRAPGTAEDEPAVDAQLAADALDVGDQIPGRVGLDARHSARDRPQPRWSNRMTR
jgi:hypothetical protein